MGDELVPTVNGLVAVGDARRVRLDAGRFEDGRRGGRRHGRGEGDAEGEGAGGEKDVHLSGARLFGKR